MAVVSRRVLIGGATLATALLPGKPHAAGGMERLQVHGSPRAAPAFTLTDAEGAPVAPVSFAGKGVVLNFWATWCTPCVEEMPLLNAFFLENKAKSWQMIGLAIDQPSAVKRFLGQHPVEYAIGMAGLEGTELMKNLSNPTGGLPFTLVLNAQGQVQMRKLGKLTESDIRSWA